ncbi:MAG: hypothetical protein JSU70_22480 [Phycisphaerales bacterium]|nr:MAG: hypothetical protein JSU70_22480 [Phycisphaerales bacterium]
MRRYELEHSSQLASLDAIKATVPPDAPIETVTRKQSDYENHGKRFSLYGEVIDI